MPVLPSESHVLFRSALFTLVALVAGVVKLCIKLNQALDGNAGDILWRAGKAHDCTAAYDGRAQAPHQLNCLLDRVPTADDIVHDDARVDFTLIHILAKHALAAFLFRPVNLFGAKRIAHPKGYRDARGAGTAH